MNIKKISKTTKIIVSILLVCIIVVLVSYIRGQSIRLSEKNIEDGSTLFNERYTVTYIKNDPILSNGIYLKNATTDVILGWIGSFGSTNPRVKEHDVESGQYFFYITGPGGSSDANSVNLYSVEGDDLYLFDTSSSGQGGLGILMCPDSSPYIDNNKAYFRQVESCGVLPSIFEKNKMYEIDLLEDNKILRDKKESL